MKNGKNINLRLVEISDAAFIVELRNSEKARILPKGATEISQQVEWLEKYKTREAAKTEFYFVIESKSGEQLGLVRLYDFQEDSFCWGSWVIKDGAPLMTAIESALLVYELAFYDLGFAKSHFDVRRANPKVITFHEKFGAKRTGETELDFLFEITKESYKQVKIKFKALLS